jgi:hypothetical protein
MAASGGVQVGDAGGDVVADQPHTFDAVDAAFGGFVGVPSTNSSATASLTHKREARTDGPTAAN